MMTKPLTTMIVDGLTWYSEDDWKALVAENARLEAKLAKAGKALGRIASNEFAGVVLTSLPPQDAAAHFARTALAKLTGGQDDD